MKTSELFAKKTVFSFEVFPPKRDMPISSMYETLESLSQLQPDFISVTCGANGQGSNRTAEVASLIKNTYHCETVAHMPCLYLTEAEVLQTLTDLKKIGVANILALRGDETPGETPAGVFQHASDLITFIKEKAPEFNIAGACYPEGHLEAKTVAADIQNLKTKVDAGASELISQLFFDNDVFYRFLERTQIAGIHVPVEAGIMPVTNQKQIERMVTLCGATLPIKFQRIIAKYGYDSKILREAGIAYAIDQIVDLLANGVDGIHVYTMNSPYIAKKITEAIKPLL
ncbi:MAG: methylenetetrahydrofolate reductase [NAD(P)H] [Megasphaera sp.]|jgi:methylenetetrahydrofolate reductase (NADPH)|nr:methylenetetrahydrofolate reductase [NAD(P)H] [Megasphaera sp.]MCH4188209.1 methylenetetrahydrofolate reductase [NAD(P)H] [Megasphaera sp.]MCH4218112.1 methylenetetrahydrofolate reductase [NAD(P)H] [Megasphaera sp.]